MKNTSNKTRKPLGPKLVTMLLWLNGGRKIYDSVLLTNWLVDSMGIINALPYRVPHLLTQDWKQERIADIVCFIKQGTMPHTIFFLHGGGYNQRPTIFHFKFLDEIHKRTGATIIAPLYPLAPNYTFMTAYEKVTLIYEQVRFLSKGHCFTLMGDSAGGGLALGLHMHLNELKLPLPDKLVLIAPALDITLTNPGIKEIEKLDRMLGPIGIREFGKRWAGGADPRQYRLSPINGDLSSVNDILVVAGNRDILYPDAELFVAKLRQIGTPVEFIIGDKMPHDYPLMPLPEAKTAIEKISNYILFTSCNIKSLDEFGSL